MTTRVTAIEMHESPSRISAPGWHLEGGGDFWRGYGQPFFTTDAAALRANEVGAEILLKATVDGSMTPPVKKSHATLYASCLHRALSRNLRVMDATAISRA